MRSRCRESSVRKDCALGHQSTVAQKPSKLQAGRPKDPTAKIGYQHECLLCCFDALKRFQNLPESGFDQQKARKTYANQRTHCHQEPDIQTNQYLTDGVRSRFKGLPSPQDYWDD